MRDGEAEQVTEPNAGQASQNPKAATEEPESAASGAVREDVGENDETKNDRTPEELSARSESSSDRNGGGYPLRMTTLY